MLALVTMLADMLALLASLSIVSVVYIPSGEGAFDMAVGAIILVLPVYILASFTLRSYDGDMLVDARRSIFVSLSAVAFSYAWFALAAFFLKTGAEFSRVQIGVSALLLAILILMIRIAVAYSFGRILAQRQSAEIHIIDGVDRPAVKGETIRWVEELGIEPDPSNPAMIAKLGSIAFGKERVVIHCADKNQGNWAFMLKCLDTPSEIVTPELDHIAPIKIGNWRGHVSLVVASGPLTWNQRVLKRAFDLIGGCAALVVFAPVMFVAAIAIKMESPGPIFFRQERIGLANRKFQIFKFRSMRSDLEDKQARTLTARNDPRVTKVGKFIRRTSIDELPQIFNVILGHMSMVGPRPHAELALAGASLYWEVDEAYWHRHVVKPGITGLAQIRGHRGNTFHEDDLRNRLQSDLEYVRDWSIGNDLWIITKTALQIFNKNAF